MSRVQVGDWVRSITTQGHSAFGWVTEVLEDKGWCKVFIIECPHAKYVMKEAFVTYPDTKVQRKVTLDAPGHYLNLIDIALDERDEDTFHALVRAYRGISRYWKAKQAYNVR